MSNLESILYFVNTTFTENHEWMNSVIVRWEEYKKKFSISELIGDKKYKEFAENNFPNCRMFIISSIRQYESYLAEKVVSTLN